MHISSELERSIKCFHVSTFGFLQVWLDLADALGHLVSVHYYCRSSTATRAFPLREVTDRPVGTSTRASC